LRWNRLVHDGIHCGKLSFLWLPTQLDREDEEEVVVVVRVDPLSFCAKAEAEGLERQSEEARGELRPLSSFAAGHDMA
jgi:hypothetical protein